MYSFITAVRFWNEMCDCDDINFPLHFSQKPWYTAYEVRAVQFRPFVYNAANHQVPVVIEPMTPRDAALTDREPLWQTSWASEYLANEGYEKYAARVGDELIALAAYEILPTALVCTLCIWRHSQNQILHLTVESPNIEESEGC